MRTLLEHMEHSGVPRLLFDPKCDRVTDDVLELALVATDAQGITCHDLGTPRVWIRDRAQAFIECGYDATDLARIDTDDDQASPVPPMSVRLYAMGRPVTPTQLTGYTNPSEEGARSADEHKSTPLLYTRGCVAPHAAVVAAALITAQQRWRRSPWRIIIPDVAYAAVTGRCIVVAPQNRRVYTLDWNDVCPESVCIAAGKLSAP